MAIARVFFVSLLVAGCSSSSGLGAAQDGHRGSGGSTLDGGSPSKGGSGGNRGGAAGAGAGGAIVGSGGAAGSVHDGGGVPSAGGAAGAPAPTPGACVSRADRSWNCDQVCLDQGKQCSEECDFGTALPGRAAYFADLDGCRANTGLLFVETAKCGDDFAPDDFMPYGAVQCCCADAGFDIATAAEKTPLCDAACKKDPYPPVPECTMDMPSCTEQCVGSNRGVDLGCAKCLIPLVGFTRSGCGSWECTCGGPSFPDPWSSACDTACAATRQHQRDVYAASPRPDPVGPPPTARFDAPKALTLLDVMTDDAGRVWVKGATSDGSGGSFLSVLLFDADLKLLWEWDDPAKRTLEHAAIARLGAETVVVAGVTPGTAPLLFFDVNGFVREVPTALQGATALSSFRDGVVVRDDSGAVPALSELDANGAVVFTAPDVTVDGFSAGFVQAVGDAGWTIADSLYDGLTWRRIDVSSAAMGDIASVAWTRKFASPKTSAVSFSGGGPAGIDRVLVWGTTAETRGDSNRNFPFVAELVDDGSLGLQWSNGDLVTPGTVNDAVHTASGHTCTAGVEEWDKSTRDPPTNGVSCSPDGCSALTVRCLDAAGTVLWNYHHRSEASAGVAVAAGPGDRLFVVGSISRDPRLSTGTHYVLMRFDP